MLSAQHRSKYIRVRRGSPLDLLGSGFLPLLQNYMGTSLRPRGCENKGLVTFLHFTFSSGLNLSILAPKKKKKKVRSERRVSWVLREKNQSVENSSKFQFP